jgi:hypothetical protein
MVSVPYLGRVRPLAGALALLVAAALATALFVDDATPPMELAAYAFGTLGILGNAFQRTRTHPGMRVLNIAFVALALVLLYLSPPRALLEGAIAALAVIGVLVESYNYHADAALLRAERDPESR